MKIIYFSPHPNIHLNTPSGPGVHIREMIRAMEELGHSVVPLIMGGQDQDSTVSMESPASVHPSKKTVKTQLKKFIPRKFWQSAKDLRLLEFDRYAQRTLEELIEKEKPDVIYERAFYMMTGGVRAASKHKVRHILEMNAPYPEERRSMEGAGFLDAFGRMREKEQIEKTQRLVVVSSALKQYVEKCVKGASAKTIVTPNAIQAGFATPSSAAVSAKREALKLDGKLTIGFIGSIFPYHGVDRLIEAFSTLSVTHNNLALLIVGDGEILPDLKRKAAESAHPESIVFTGKIPHAEAPLYISTMDICVMPHSNWYGSPVKIFEYGALEKPIVAPDFIPLRDVITSGIHGLLFQEGQLQEALSAMIKQPDTASTMAKRFREKVMDEHTWVKMASLALD